MPSNPTIQPPRPSLGQIEQAIEKGLDYLGQHQYPSGEFCVYLSGDDGMQGWNQLDNSNFPTALIGSSLLFLKNHPGARTIIDKAAACLRYQMGFRGSWNYFTNTHPLRKICPQDADDTATISAFLRECQVDFPASLNQKLLRANRRADGLFYTWFALRFRWNSDPAYWRLALRELLRPAGSFLFWKNTEFTAYDVDAVVNANVLYYLGPQEDLAPVIRYLVRIIQDSGEADCDKWYRTPVAVYYFFSRNFNSGIAALEAIRQPMLDRLLRHFDQNGSIAGNELDTAVALCSLLNLGYTGPVLDLSAGYLLQAQKAHGEWPRRRFYYAGPKKLGGYGSEELTTAFCLEALARYRDLRKTGFGNDKAL